jgi:DNA helicase-2/ATP-dependent DNA helicase PcrA
MPLNAQQQSAVESGESRIIVSAGAGTGKTTVLTERIRHLLSQGIEPREILALTFTRYAANEMKKRLNHKKDIMIGTFHAWALKLLRDNADKLGLNKRLDVITEIERDDIIKQIAEECGIKLTRFDYAETLWGNRMGDHGLVVKEYLKILNRYGLLDFELIIFYTTELLRKFDVALPYSHILIDEFQDTSAHIWEIVKMIKTENIFIVGDIDQCIYFFAGSRPEIMKALTESNYHLYKLETNYRCPADVITGANHLINYNVRRIERGLIANKTITGLEVITASEQYGFDRYKTILSDTLSDTDTAILCRTNKDIEETCVVLNELGIKYNRLDGSATMNKAGFRLRLSALRLLAYNFNDMACEWVYRAYYPTKILALKQAQFKAMDEGRTLLDCIDIPWFDIFKDKITTTTEALQWLGKLPYNSNLEILLDGGADYLSELMTEEQDLREFLSTLSLRSMQDDMSHKAEGLKIMTVHGAKGLEFDTVIVMNAINGRYPIIRKDTDPEEERRIFYVAITRAINKCIIITTEGNASPYIGEMN